MILVAAVLLTSDRGRRGEFSPYTLEYRIQTEHTFFGTGVPFHRSSYRSADHPLVEVLINEGFVTPQPDRGNHWELIFHWNDSWRDGYGGLYYVFFRDREQIIEWSRNNRECAQLYWSEGFRLLRSDDAWDAEVGCEILNSCWRYSDLDELTSAMHQIKTTYAKERQAAGMNPFDSTLPAQ